MTVGGKKLARKSRIKGPKNTPAKASRSLYDVDDLISLWESGWKNLAKLECVSKDVEREAFGSDFNNPLQQSVFGAEEILVYNSELDYRSQLLSREDNPLYFVTSICALVMPSEKNGIQMTTENQYRAWKGLYSSSEDNAVNRRRVKKLLSSFATSSTYGEALGKITSQKNVQKFVEYWSRQNLKWPETGRKLSSSSIRTYAIRARCRKAFQWLEHGLASPEACEESWWHCVWLFIEPLLDKMLQIKRKIESDIPLSEGEIIFLNYHIGNGAPRIEMLNSAAGQCSPKVILQQTVGQWSSDLQCEKMADILLVQPAYVLAQQLERECMKPRFIRQCRAPSCGKMFYTGRKDATACPGSQGDKKNPCALEWIRYKRYLKKIGKKPEKDWDNKKLQQDFISYDSD